MRAWLVKALKWALRKIVKPDPLFEQVKGLVKWADEEFGEIRGGRKRDQVLNRLIDAYPEKRERDLALLIELAIQETK